MNKVLMSPVAGSSGPRARRPAFLSAWVLLLVVAGAVVGAAPASAAPDTCPNAAVRAAQGTSGLPECRAYEMVSPLEKNGIGVLASYTPNRSGGIGAVSNGGGQLTPDGKALLFTTAGALPGTEGASGFTRSISRRSATDWASKPVDPPTATDTTYLRTQLTYAMSDDAERTVVYSNKALAPGAVEGGQNAYVRDLAHGTYALIATGVGNWSEQGAESSLVAVTPSLESVFFTDGNEWRSGQGAHQIAEQPAGAPAPIPGALASAYVPAVSSDGRSKVVALSDTADIYTAGLFLVRDGEPTIQVTASQHAGDDPDQRRRAVYLGASSDLSKIFFLSPEPLTDDSDTGDPGAPDDTLYRYDVATGKLTDLLADVPAGGRALTRNRLGRVSPDGSTMTFQAAGAFRPGATVDSHNVYVVRGDEVQFVADLGFVDLIDYNNIQLSSDGRYVAFMARANLTSYDSTGADCDAYFISQCAQIFVYDAVAETLSCASCNPDGSPPKGWANYRPNQLPGLRHVANTLTDDGKVAFESSDPLVPQDVNGRRDVYTWQAGALELISSGDGDADSLLTEMSADGSTIAFATRQQLVGRDTDDLVDAYVSRVDGGFASQVAPPSAPLACRGAECQGAAAAPGALPVAGSVTFAGSGNGEEPPLRSAATRPLEVSGSAGAVSVRTPAKGVIRVSGASLITTSRTVTKAGSVKVALRLTAKAKRTLARSHRLRVKVRVSFTPKTGKATVKSLVLTFRQTAAKGGRS
jgi:hypothetical protein